MLEEFWTTIAMPQQSPWDLFLPGSVKAELRRRAYDVDILRKIHRSSTREFVRLLAGRIGWLSLTKHETGMFSYDAIAQHQDQRVARRLAKGGIDAVYAYEDSALQTFREAARLDIKRIYELPIGHWRLGRRIYEEEAELQPEWAMTLEGLKDSAAKLERKDEEARLAELIIVPSAFVASSLSECPGVKGQVHVVNYGCPTPADKLSYRQSGPLKVLFAGSLGARKGLPYVLASVEGLNVELTLIGPLPSSHCPTLKSQLQKHRYLGSVPRERVLEEMQSNEVFLFPSLFEGLANVLLEAMSQGLVPITTANAGAQGVVEDGYDGFLVPIRSVDSIRERLAELTDDRDKMNQMRAAASQKALQRSWSKYHTELVAATRPSTLAE